MSFEKNEQYQKFVDLLCDRNARCLWQVKGPPMHSDGRGIQPSRLEAWSVPHLQGILILHAYPSAGVEAYVPGGPDGFDEIAKWLGPTTDERRAAGTAGVSAAQLEQIARDLNPHRHQLKAGNGNHLCTACKKTGELAWLVDQECAP